MMMKEIALHILDIAQNSISAGARFINISIAVNTGCDNLSVSVTDDGRGMDRELMKAVEDPFTTSRTTRKVGLGIPFFKVGALMTGGSFNLESEVGKGTKIQAVYTLSHLDRPPLGNIAETMLTLIVCNESIDFAFTYGIDGNDFDFDTREVKAVLGDQISLSAPEIMGWIRDSLSEGINEINQSLIDGGASI